MKNMVCQHLWKRDFNPLQERWYPYNAVFGLADRLCFLLIDHFGYDHGTQVDQAQVPVVWVAWVGEILYVDSEFLMFAVVGYMHEACYAVLVHYGMSADVVVETKANSDPSHVGPAEGAVGL